MERVVERLSLRRRTGRAAGGILDGEILSRPTDGLWNPESKSRGLVSLQQRGGPFWCVHSQAASRTEGTELEYTTNTQNYHVDESHGVSRWELQVRHEGRQGGQVSHRRRADGTAADQIPSGGAEAVRGCCPGRAPGESASDPLSASCKKKNYRGLGIAANRAVSLSLLPKHRTTTRIFCCYRRVRPTSNCPGAGSGPARR